MTDYLVDNSVWARAISGDSLIVARLRRIERAPDESLVLDIQSALWRSGLVRAAGSLAILMAGYAIVNDATVLAADRDFGHIARISDLQHEHVAPSA